MPGERFTVAGAVSSRYRIAGTASVKILCQLLFADPELFSDFGRFLFLYLEPAEAMENGSVYRFQGCMKKKGGTARYSPLMDFLQGIEEIDQGRFLIRALTVTN